MKRTLTFLLAIIMILGMIPVSAFATEVNEISADELITEVSEPVETEPVQSENPVASGIDLSDWEYEIVDDAVWILCYLGDDRVVTVPSEIEGYTVTDISEMAFCDNTYVTSITIPDTVTYIGDDAFSGCSNLKSIVLPKKLVHLRDGLFTGCSSLSTITLPEDLTLIGAYVFFECTALTSITIPDTVTAIYDEAFAGCKKLASITIPDSVQLIASAAFSGCSSLTSITLPKQLVAIDYETFYDCSTLRSVSIPVSVDGIGESAFAGCSSLKDVYYAGSESQWKKIDILEDNDPLLEANIHCADAAPEISDWEYSISKKKITLTEYLGEETAVTIPSEIDGYPVVALGDDLFYGYSRLTGVTIPSGIKVIGAYAFCDCTKLTNITIRETVTDIGEGAFCDCSALNSITFEGDAPEVDEDAEDQVFYGVNATAYYPGDNDTWTEAVRLAFGGDLTWIPVGGSCQHTNTTLKNQKKATCAQEGYTGDTVCDNCGVVISRGESVPKGDHDYSGGSCVVCGQADTSLWVYSVSNGKVTINGYNGADRVLTVPSVINGFPVTAIGSYAFDYSAITGITLPEGITVIENDAFWKCSELASVTLPNSLTTIGSSAFSNCTALKSIELPNGLATISGWAFEGCTALTNIAIPQSVTSIKYSAFSGCTALTSITIPNGITVIENSTFDSCENLTSVTLPASLTSIESSAFEECAKLQKVSFSGTKDQWAAITVEYSNSDLLEADLYLNGIKVEEDTLCYTVHNGNATITKVVGPVGSKLNLPAKIDGYPVKAIGAKALYGRSRLTNIVIPESVTQIGDHALAYCGVTDITIPKSVTQIGEYAFYHSGLTKITIPDNITSIGIAAFSYCTDLTSASIPTSMTVIPADLFESCSNLKTVKLPKGLTGIGSGVFEYCSSLTSIQIPETVTEIGADAFSTSGLKSVHIPGSVQTVGDHTFAYTPLVSVTMGEGVTKIDTNAFASCGYLTSITFPKTLVSVGHGAFTYCESLTNLNFPEGMTTLANYALNGCTKLATITLPKSLEKIGDYVFKYCTGLKKVYFRGTQSQWGTVSIGQGNDALEKAKFYFGQSGPGEPKPPVSLAKYSVTLKTSSFTYDGTEKTPTVTVKKTAKTKTALKAGKDYILTYENNVEVGKATVTVTGIGTYGGSVTKSFKILPQKAKLTVEVLNHNSARLTSSVVTGATEYWFYRDGKQIGKVAEPTYTVSGLTAGKSYEFTVKAVAVVNGVEYAGATSAAVSGKPVYAMEDCSVTLKYQVREYTGKAVTNTVTVKNASGKILKKDTDYKVSYQNNKNMGVATAVITGMGKYAGKITATYVIGPKAVTGVTGKAISSTAIQVSFSKQKGAENYVIYVDGEQKAITTENSYVIDGLAEGNKYSVTVAAGVRIGEEIIYGAPSKAVSVAIKMNIRDCFFDVHFDNEEFHYFYYTGKSIKAKVDLWRGAFTEVEKKLKEGVDYTITYTKNKDIGVGKMTIKGIGAYTGSREVEMVIIPKAVTNLKVKDSTKTTVTLSWTKSKGAAYYYVYVDGYHHAKTTSNTYKVKNLDGNEHTFSVIAVKHMGSRLGEFSSEENPVITARAATYMGGYKVSLAYTSTVFDGEAKTPAVTVKKTSKSKAALTLGEDYTVSYKNNSAIGKATVTITGIGEYTGTIVATFTINPPKVTDVEAVATGKKSVKVTFQTVEDLEGVEYWVYVDGKCKAKTTEGSCTISGLKANKTYKITVRTVVKVNGTKYYSGYTSAIKVKTKK